MPRQQVRPSRRRRRAVAALTLGLALAGAVAPGSAAADDATPALPIAPAVPGAAAPPATASPTAADLDALRARSEQVAADLRERTAAWEQAVAEAGRTRAAAEATAAEAVAAAALAEDAQQQLDLVVAASYRHGQPSTAEVLLSGDDLADTISAVGYLSQVAGSRDRAVAALVAAQDDARALAAEARRLSVRADAEERAAAEQVAALQADVLAAQRELEAATAAHAAEQERLRLAEEERRRQEQAAEQARRAAAAAAETAAPGPAAPAPVPAASAGVRAAPTGGCATADVSGHPNGMLDASVLCALRTAPAHRLRGDAAAAFDALSAAHAAEYGGRGVCITDSYRSYAAQVDVFRRKPTLAALPGTSNHGWGVAVDLCGGVEQFGTPAHAWMRAHAPAFGWEHPAWARADGSRPEAWHWEFTG